MPRERKSIEVRPVDETEDERDRVERFYRLDPGREVAPEQHVVKLKAEETPQQKLDVAKREDVETRSIEPGIDVLIDAVLPTMNELEEEWGTAVIERRPLPWGWFALIGIVVLGAAAWSLHHVRQAEDQIEVIRMETQQVIEQDTTSEAVARNLIGQINEVVKAFSEAKDVEAMAATVRQAKRVRPLMDDYYSRKTYRPYGPARIESLQPLTLAMNGNFWMARLRFSKDLSRLNILMEELEDGRVLVDWETAVCYQPMDWDAYARERPMGTRMEFRVYVEPEVLYSHEFVDDTQWRSYKLTALNSEEMLYGYAQAGSQAAEVLDAWFQRNGRNPTAMILRLALPNELESPRGVVIEEVRSVRWIYVVPPEGGS